MDFGEHQPYVFCVTSPFPARVKRIFWAAVFGTIPFRFEETSTAPNGRFIYIISVQMGFSGWQPGPPHAFEIQQDRVLG